MRLRFQILVIAVGVVLGDFGPPLAVTTANVSVSANATAANSTVPLIPSPGNGSTALPSTGNGSVVLPLVPGNGSSVPPGNFSALPSLVTGPIAIPTLMPPPAANSSVLASMPSGVNGTVPSTNGTIIGGPSNSSVPTVPPLFGNGTTLFPSNGTRPPMFGNGSMPLFNSTMLPLFPPNGTLPLPMGNLTLPGFNGTLPMFGGNGTVAPNGTALPPLNGTTVKPLFPLMISMSANGSISALPMNSTMLPLNATLPTGMTTLKPVNGTLNGTTLITMLTTTKPAALGNSTTKSLQTGTTTSYCSSTDALVFAGTCYLTLEGLSAEMENMNGGKLIDTSAIQTLGGYCRTFQMCLTQLTPCGDFNDTAATGIITEFCSFYRFATSNLFIGCTNKMATVDPKYQTCMTAASEAMLDFNSTLPAKCAALKNSTSCAVSEVENQCSIISTYSYQMFVNRHLQQWNC